MNQLPVIVIGAGGHSKALIDMLHQAKRQIIGCTGLNKGLNGTEIMSETVIGLDDDIFKYTPREIRLVNGLVSIGTSNRRKEIFEHFSKAGYLFETLIHPSAVISEEVGIAQGVLVMAGAKLMPGVHIGKNALINTSAVIDHDCNIGAHAHIAPGAIICGAVSIGSGAFIGAGAVVIQGITIGRDAVIGAGSVVTKDVHAKHRMVGVPVRRIG
ncbi:MAG: acetyltransferase [Gammaproteobacteria bacterium]|nr:acetyltransferase [Gammaproteobacteria bacterium]